MGRDCSSIISILCSSKEVVSSLANIFGVKSNPGNSDTMINKVKEKIGTVYSSVFVNSSESGKVISEMLFSARTKNDILRASSFLSEFVEY